MLSLAGGVKAEKGSEGFVLIIHKVGEDCAIEVRCSACYVEGRWFIVHLTDGRKKYYSHSQIEHITVGEK